jgi:hypothetical protein
MYIDYSEQAAAILATISGDTISYSAPYVFNRVHRTYYITATALSSNQVLIAYRVGDNFYGTAILATIADNTISYSSEQIFNRAATWNIAATKLSETTAMIVYRTGGQDTAILAVVCRNRFLFSFTYVFNKKYTTYLSAIALSETKILIFYRDDISLQACAVLATVSDDTIYYSREIVFSSTETREIITTRLSSSQILIAFKDMSNSDYVTTVLATVTRDSIFFSSKQLFNITDIYTLTVTALSETQAIMTYRDNVSRQGASLIITVSREEEKTK